MNVNKKLCTLILGGAILVGIVIADWRCRNCGVWNNDWNRYCCNCGALRCDDMYRGGGGFQPSQLQQQRQRHRNRTRAISGDCGYNYGVNQIQGATGYIGNVQSFSAALAALLNRGRQLGITVEINNGVVSARQGRRNFLNQNRYECLTPNQQIRVSQSGGVRLNVRDRREITLLPSTGEEYDYDEDDEYDQNNCDFQF